MTTVFHYSSHDENVHFFLPFHQLEGNLSKLDRFELHWIDHSSPCRFFPCTGSARMPTLMENTTIYAYLFLSEPNHWPWHQMWSIWSDRCIDTSTISWINWACYIIMIRSVRQNFNSKLCPVCIVSEHSWIRIMVHIWPFALHYRLLCGLLLLLLGWNAWQVSHRKVHDDDRFFNLVTQLRITWISS